MLPVLLTKSLELLVPFKIEMHPHVTNICSAEEFAALTKDFQTIAPEAIRITSWREQIPLSPKTFLRLIDFYKFGQRDEPFENC